MELLENKWRRWERENWRELVQLIGGALAAGERLAQNVVRMANLGAYLAWMGAKGAVRLACAVIQPPRLVRRTGPETRPQFREEFERVEHRWPMNLR